MEPVNVEILDNLKLFKLIAWISLPTVMYGGYLLLGFLVRGKLSDFQLTYFRAGHAHVGVLLLMALLYLQYLEQTNLSPSVQVGAASALVVGILAQSGGFFLHLLTGQPGKASWGTHLTRVGAVILAAASLTLAYGLFL